MVRHLVLILFLAFSATLLSRAEGEVVVLTDTPVAEFTLPDGSVIKNAFVWRRSSEGLMIVHDDGQYFLNYALLPPDWRAAYLGESAVVEEPEPEHKLYETYDPYVLMPILEKVPGLTETGRTFVLRKGADEEAEKQALALGILQSLLAGDVDDVKRLMLIVEEKELNIESVQRDALFVECGTCDGTGRREVTCAVCGGTGKCPKCNGTGRLDSATGKTTTHCTKCRGTGVCPECGGEGSKSTVCPVCHGRGKLLEKRYCEIKRDYYVHTINQSASPDIPVSVTHSDRDRILAALKNLPELERGAARFYASEAYTGGVDTNLLVACTMYSMLQGKMEDAVRFYMTIEAHYGEGNVLDIKKYLNTCDVCDGTGVILKDCRTCNGTGKCPRCGGDGELDSEFLDRTTPCTTCRGTGKCTACNGVGKIKIRCGNCEGTGRDFEKDRAQIRLEIEVVALNRFYLDQK
ncbi:hypothetical protein P4C99_20655 [Pontiellaceae bacterium B1224]|nr:hypothetical protein [Pontiellaceae bacterium B1224]